MSRLKTSLGTRSTLSARQVLDSDDLMSEILLLLPPETIYKLMLVSKRWFLIISSSFFRHTYLNKWKSKYKLIGYFDIKTKNSRTFRYELRRPLNSKPFIRPFSSRISLLKDKIKTLKRLGYYMDSSNGLILCVDAHKKDYFFWDPNTHMRHLHLQLPQPEIDFESCCTALIVEGCPSKELISYKVIRAECENQESTKLRVEIFSSKTKTWSYSELTCPEPMSLSPRTQRKVINGVVYYYYLGGVNVGGIDIGGKKVAIYDSNNEEEKRIDLIKLPKRKSFDRQVMGDSGDGCLQYGRYTDLVMEIWNLEKVKGIFQWKKLIQHKLNYKVLWLWYDAYAEKVSINRDDVKQLLAFPIRNETHSCSMSASTSTRRLKWSKKKEEHGFPYGISEMSCHSFDDLGLPFFISYIRRCDVSKIIGEKLLCHYVSSSLK